MEHQYLHKISIYLKEIGMKCSNGGLKFPKEAYGVLKIPEMTFLCKQYFSFSELTLQSQYHYEHK